jgi:MerR-like DNA binding protein
VTLYGIAEIAQAIGVSPNLVKQWHRRGKLPPPTAVLAMGPVWTGRRIEAWIAERRA